MGIRKSHKKQEKRSETRRLIGRKGIGFTSALRLSDRPRVLGSDAAGGVLAMGIGSE